MVALFQHSSQKRTVDRVQDANGVTSHPLAQPTCYHHYTTWYKLAAAVPGTMNIPEAREEHLEPK